MPFTTLYIQNLHRYQGLLSVCSIERPRHIAPGDQAPVLLPCTQADSFIPLLFDNRNLNSVIYYPEHEAL
jgi:hypothetical protein